MWIVILVVMLFLVPMPGAEVTVDEFTRAQADCKAHDLAVHKVEAWSYIFHAIEIRAHCVGEEIVIVRERKTK